MRLVLAATAAASLVACADLFGPGTDARLATVEELVVADSVPAGTAIEVVVRWMHGWCQRPSGIRTVQRADTVFIGAYVRHDPTDDIPCEADGAVEREETIQLPGRAATMLQLRGQARNGISASAQVRVY